jgi:hypothetical protein
MKHATIRYIALLLGALALPLATFAQTKLTLRRMDAYSIVQASSGDYLRIAD